MQASATSQNDPGRPLAVAAESLYLVNLMLLPGLAFLVLLLLYLTQFKTTTDLAKNHLSQTLGISMLGGALIVIVLALFFLLGGFGPYTWLWAIMYFTLVHSSLIFMGVFGFIKAHNNQHFVFPVLGKLFHP